LSSGGMEFIFYFGTREGLYYVWLSRFWVNGGWALGLSHQATMLRLMYAVCLITSIMTTYTRPCTLHCLMIPYYHGENETITSPVLIDGMAYRMGWGHEHYSGAGWSC